MILSKKNPIWGRPFKQVGVLRFDNGTAVRRLGYASQDMKAGEPIDLCLQDASDFAEIFASHIMRDKRRRFLQKLGIY